MVSNCTLERSDGAAQSAVVRFLHLGHSGACLGADIKCSICRVQMAPWALLTGLGWAGMGPRAGGPRGASAVPNCILEQSGGAAQPPVS